MNTNLQEWINVSERLPNPEGFREHVSVLVRIQKVQCGFLKDDFAYEVCRFYIGKSGPLFTNSTAGIVTHWMQLPQFLNNIQ